jgi:hypothetical protein
VRYFVRLPARSRRLVAIFASCLVLILLYLVQTKLEVARIAAAPHITDEYLIDAYEKHLASARQRFDHQLIVLTGEMSGYDEGLIGDGAVHMGSIECDPGASHDSFTLSLVKAWLSPVGIGGYRDIPCQAGRPCTLLGVCEGIDKYGEIHLSECRTIHR